MQRNGHGWQPLAIPAMERLPRPVFVRAEDMPPWHYFPTHVHAWAQFVHAVSGVMWVDTTPGSFVLPPGQALWVPAGVPHAVYAKHGAHFRSLYIDSALPAVADRCCVLTVTPLLRELVVAASALPPVYDADGEHGRLIAVLLDQIRRMPQAPMFLPLPQHPALRRLCERLEQTPGDRRGLELWADWLGMSPRTLARHFERELGIGFRQWRTRLRLLKSIDLLGAGDSVTGVALELGYQSVSAFIAVFRRRFGVTPAQYRDEIQSLRAREARQ